MPAASAVMTMKRRLFKGRLNISRLIAGSKFATVSIRKYVLVVLGDAGSFTRSKS